MFKTVTFSVIALTFAFVIYLTFNNYYKAQIPLEPGEFNITESTLPISASRYKKGYKAPISKYKSRQFNYSAKSRKYHFYEGTTDKSRPLIVLLHGSQRNGASMIDMWEGIARKNDLLIVAPDSWNKQGWSLRSDPLSFFNALLEDVQTNHGFNSEKIYLFGHSSGARHASFISLMDSPFHGVAVHAGAPSIKNLNIVLPSASSRKTPIIYFLGTDDHIFNVEDTLKVAKLMASSGQNVSLTLLKKHNHWYYTAAPYINQKAWNFLYISSQLRSK